MRKHRARALVEEVSDVSAAAVERRCGAGAALDDVLPALADRALRGAAARGGGACHRYAARGYLTGVLRARASAAAWEAIVPAVAAFLSRARGRGCDAAEAARGLVEGAIAWAAEMGEDVERAGNAAGQAAVDACHGREAGVLLALRTNIGGVDVRPREPARA